MDTLASLLAKKDHYEMHFWLYEKIEESAVIAYSDNLYLDLNDFNTVYQYTKNIENLRQIFIKNSSSIGFGFDLSTSLTCLKKNLILTIMPINAKNLQKLAQIFLNTDPKNGGSYDAEPYQEAAVDPKFCKYIEAKVIHLNQLFVKVNSLEYCRQIYNIYAMVDEFLNHYPEGVISEEEVAIGTLVYKEVEKMQGGTGGRLFDYEKDFNERVWEYKNKIMKACVPPSHATLRELIDMVQYGR